MKQKEEATIRAKEEDKMKLFEKEKEKLKNDEEFRRRAAAVKKRLKNYYAELQAKKRRQIFLLQLFNEFNKYETKRQAPGWICSVQRTALQLRAVRCYSCAHEKMCILARSECPLCGRRAVYICRFVCSYFH